MDEVVPGWMCLQGLDVQQRAFLGGHFFSSRIESTIKSSVTSSPLRVRVFAMRFTMMS